MDYFISDLHLGHKNVTKDGSDFDNRPFANLEEMHNVIINNWNSTISNSDDVYVLGDLCWKCGDYSIDLLSQLNGKIHLITGNHDRFNNEYKKMFVEIVPYKELSTIINNEKIKIVLSHYPIMFYNKMRHNAILLYGHVHNSIEETLFQEFCEKLKTLDDPISNKCYNVGCMMPYINYTPRTLSHIINNA